MATAGKPIKCRAAVVWKVGDPFAIENVEVAVPQKGEVRVRMASTGVCHSDLHVKNGCIPKWHFPAVLGHEGAGVIESVGEGVTSVKPATTCVKETECFQSSNQDQDKCGWQVAIGDQNVLSRDVVVLAFKAYCGECDRCKDPRTNVCRTQPFEEFHRDGTSRITCKGKVLSQMNSVSTFSEYTVAPEFNVTKVNPKANPNNIAFAGCCLPTGYGAVMNAAKVHRGATCAVWGLGGVGMCVAMGCRDSGASKVIGIDTNPNKFDLAKDFGCTEFLNPKDVEDVPKTLAEMTNGGVDYCFVSVGFVPAMEQAFQSSHPYWGKTVIIGLANRGETMRAGIWELIDGRQLIGTSYGSYKARLAIPTLVNKVLDGQIQLEKLISHRFPLDKINEAYAMLKTGESLRTLIDFDLKA